MIFTMQIGNKLTTLSETDKLDLERAITTLKELGAKEIFLFGSMARGDADKYSDWDFGVIGLPKELFFTALGKLLDNLNREADLVDLELESRFAALLKKTGELIRVA